MIVTVVVSATRDHGFESPVLHEWLPPATPWTYMDSFGEKMNREILLAKIKSEASNCGEHPPVVELDDFFQENRQEDSIAPNQVGYGRPSLSDLYQRFRSIRDRDDVDAVLISLHDE